MAKGGVLLSLADVTLSRGEGGVFVARLHGQKKDKRGNATNVSNPSFVRSLGAVLDQVEHACVAGGGVCGLVICSEGKFFSNG